jgi:hypothetical protein
MHRVNQWNYSSVEDAASHQGGVPEPVASVPGRRSKAVRLPCSVCGSAIRIPIENLNHEGRDNG